MHVTCLRRACAVHRFRYADVFMNWLAALHRLRLQNYCIFAIDPDTKAWLEARQVPTFGVYIKRFAALWYVRLIVLRALAEVGVTFIHSDTDAIWLRDPLGAFFAPTQPALLKFSQGTVAPSQLQARWGFVVCGGLFYARASRFTRAYFQTVLEHLLQNPLVPRHATVCLPCPSASAALLLAPLPRPSPTPGLTPGGL